MSTFSLPRLLNGGGLSKNKTINTKFFSLNRLKKSATNNSINGKSYIGSSSLQPIPQGIVADSSKASSTASIKSNGDASHCNGSVVELLPQPPRRQAINRKGSIVKNQFRGIKKDYLESQTNLIIHSMTVSLIEKKKPSIMQLMYFNNVIKKT